MGGGAVEQGGGVCIPLISAASHRVRVALEQATEAKLPFGMGEVDLTSPMAALGMFIALVFGAILWNAADRIGSRQADRAVNWIETNLPMGGEATGSGGSTGATV